MIEPEGTAPNRPVHGGGCSARLRLKVALASTIVLGALLLGAWLAVALSAAERALPGVHWEDIDVSRLTRREIVGQIQTWARLRAHRKIAFTVSGRSLTFEPEAAGFHVDAEASAARAIAVGRSGGVARRWFGAALRWLRPETLEARLDWDQTKLSALEDEWERVIPDPPFEGGLSIALAAVTPLYPRAGTRLDRPRVAAQLSEALRTGRTLGALATRSESPQIERSEVDRIAARASGMLSADVLLITQDGAHRLQLTPAQVGSVLRVKVGPTQGTLELSCLPEATRPYLDPLRSELEHPPQNARFTIDSHDHVQIEAGHAAVLLDEAAVARALCLAAQSTEKKGDLPLSAGAQPAFSTEAAERAGVSGLVGSYTTHHACCQPRVENIHHIADLLDGTLVAPGQTFSVNQLVGPRTIKNGFRPAPSIEDGDMVDTVGGGVSQFATTLFNALFNAGYDILERQPHSYWFTRYPMGYDATLSYPHPDIVFKNDTEASALIKAQYTDTAITVKVYGNNGGRRVRAEVSERQNIVPPPVEFIPNPRLDADEEKTREGGMIGWTVTVKRTVSYADGKIKEERRKVTYKPRARRVEVHPCRIPAGEPGHTGERCPIPEKDAADGAPSTPADTGTK